MVSINSEASKMMRLSNQEEHYGNRIRLVDDYKELMPLENYFYNKCMQMRIHCDYDCIACETFKFKTMSYTTYAGALYVHPLQPELAAYQFYNASTYEGKQVNYVDFFLKVYKEKRANKYNFSTRSNNFDYNCNELVVLPGSNKIKKGICLNKLKWILKNYPNAVYKPHPLTEDRIIDELREHLPGARIAPYDSDLYTFMENATKVFTTHMSESALYATVLEKEIEPIDAFQERHINSFAPINYHLFMGQGASWVNRTFSSPCSGIFHPNVDTNWKTKMDKYFDYILFLREKLSSHYILKENDL